MARRRLLLLCCREVAAVVVDGDHRAVADAALMRVGARERERERGET